MKKHRPSFIVSSLGVMAIGLCATTLRATTYYVSPSGSDTNNGTSTSTPWKTVGKVNGTTLSPGDTVAFEGGATFTGTTLTTKGDGTAASPTTYTSYGTGKALIQTPGIGGLTVGTSYTTVGNLAFRGDWDTGANTGTAGVTGAVVKASGQGVHNVTLDSLEVSAYGLYGVQFQNNTDGVRITHCTVHNNRDSGIIFTAGPNGHPHTNAYVGDCTVYGNSGVSTNTTSNTGSGIVLGGVDGAVVEGCVSYNNGWRCPSVGGPVGIWSWRSNNVVVQFCEAYGNDAVNADGGGFDIDGGDTNCVIQYCYAHGNAGAGFAVFEYSGAPQLDNNVVRYNLSEGDGVKRHGGIYLWNGQGASTFTNTYVYNNTVYVPHGNRPGLWQNGGALTNTWIWNNVFHVGGSAKSIDVGSPGTGFVLQGNCYWNNGGAFSARYSGTTYTSLAAYRSGAGQEMLGGQPVGLAANPLFTGAGGGEAGYRLQSGSPLIDAGLDLQTLFGVDPGAQDFYGLSIPQNSAFDVGAAEYDPNQPPPPSGVTTDLAPEADTYVRDGSYAGINYGTDPTLVVKNSSSGNNRISYLRFPVPAGGTVLSATLHLKVTGIGAEGSGARTVEIRQLSDDSWSETGATWNNKPSSTGTLIATIDAGTVGQDYAIDVSSYVSQEAAGDGEVSFVLVQPSGVGKFVAFGSRENTGNEPVLEVVRDVVTTLPEADTYVRDGSYAGINYGTDPTLVAKNSSSGNNRISYLRFPLSGIGSFTTATLHLKVTGIGTEGSGARTVEIRQLSDDSWSETGATWNNKPSSTGTLIATIDAGTVGQDYTIDVSSYVSQEASGDGKVSFVLVQPSGVGKFVAFGSRENAGNEPILELQ